MAAAAIFVMFKRNRLPDWQVLPLLLVSVALASSESFCENLPPPPPILNGSFGSRLGSNEAFALVTCESDDHVGWQTS